MKTQQFLSAFLLDKQNVDTNHHELSFLPSVGGKRKCSFVFLFFSLFFLFFPPFFLFFFFTLQTKLMKKSLPS